MFKQSTGQSPHLHILLQRIECAKELLAGTDSPIIEVAADVGFRTQGHFTGVFHSLHRGHAEGIPAERASGVEPGPLIHHEAAMTNETSMHEAVAFELRFQSLYQRGRMLAFPCDLEGHVDLDRFSERVRNNYLYARAMLGREYAWPRVALCALESRCRS